MKKIFYVLLAILIAIPSAISLSVLIKNNYQETKSTNISKTIDEQFDKIYVNSISGDVELVVGDDKNTSLYYNEDDIYTYEIIQENEENQKVLKINQKKINDSKFNFFDKNNNIRKIRITVPHKNLESVSIRNLSGDNIINGLNCNNLDINSTAGDIKIGKVICNNIKIDLQSGDIVLGSISADSSHITSKSGDVEFNNSSCSDLVVNKLFGDVSLRDLDTSKLFVDSVEGNVGLIRLKCNSIYSSTSLGDIFGCILGDKKDYKIISKVENGDNNLENKSDGEKILELKVKSGDINIDFEPKS